MDVPGITVNTKSNESEEFCMTKRIKQEGRFSPVLLNIVIG